MKSLLLVLACLLPICASAAPPSGLKAQAEAAYQDGAKAFGAKDFNRALKLFDHAFKLDPSPILLYNIARCHEEMGTLEPAIRNFELYLARAPDAADRDDVERRIRVMDAIKRRQAKMQFDTPLVAPAKPVASSDAARWWGYGALGAGVVAVAVGSGMGVAADSAAQDHREAETRSDKSRFETEANDKATLANVSYIVGGALIATGASLLIYDAVSGDTTVQVAPAPGGISVHVRF